MKIIKNIYPLFLFFSLGVAWGNNNYQASKTIRKSFPISNDTYIDLSNRYGDIEIQNWEKDSVRFEININVNTRSKNEGQDLINKIKCEFSSSESFVIAKTNPALGSSTLSKSYQDLKTGLLGSDDRMSVDIKVYLPQKNDLKISNRFGNVYMNDWDGMLELELYHGDFRAKKLKDVKSITLKYGKMKIIELDKTNLFLTGAKLVDITKAKELEITSSSSEIEITDIDILNISSKHDEYEIENLKEMSGKATLSQIKIDYLDLNMKLKAKYGSAKIKHLKNGVKLVFIGERTDLTLRLSDLFEGNIFVDIENKKDFANDSDFKVISNTQNSEERDILKLSKGDSSKSNISIYSKKGFIQLEN